MEERAPKRPRLAGEAAPEDATAPSQQTANKSPLRSRPKRPSYASPTKASMERYNPQILERRRSASPPKSPSPTRRPPYRLPSVSNTPTTRPERSADNTAASTAGNLEIGSAGVETPGSARSSPIRARGGMAAAPKRSPAKPSPRPLPPPAPEGEDEINPFMGRTLRRSPETGIDIPPPQEPELPPSIDDPTSSTPPRGIHSSSPSRWKSKRKTYTGSPLKKPPARPGDSANEAEDLFKRNLFGGKGTAPSQLRQGTALAEVTNNVRRVPASDENYGKKKEIDALHDELARLRKDLEVTKRQNERIRAIQKSGRTIDLADKTEILDIVKRQVLPEYSDPQPDQPQLLAKAALDPMAIVPFGKPATSALPADADEDDPSDIKSHHPVSMSAEEELPFLQLFTPFSVTSNLTLLPQVADESLRQLFSIQLRSRECPGLFTARLEATVDAMKHNILSLSVSALEPAAQPELGAFLDRICTGDCNRTMQRNVEIVTWAMGEWLRVAEQRGRFWSQLHEATATKARLLDTSRNTRSRKSKRWSSGQEKENDENEKASLKREDMLRFMGRQSFDMSVPSAAGSGSSSYLRLNWKIEFDWTGEARSNVAVMVGVPGKWHKADSKGVLGKLPSLFEHLVECGEEPNMAVRKVIALLAGEE